MPATMVNALPGSPSEPKAVRTPTSSSSMSTPSPGVRKNSNLSATSKGSKHSENSGVVKDVALKIIPKKKVKGNEAAVWGEMEVLKGLDHENIVRPVQIFWRTPPHTFLRSNSTSGLNQEPNTISPLNSLLAENSSNGLAREESSQRPTRFPSYGK